MQRVPVPVARSMDPRQRQRVRLTALVLGLVALALYAGFIAYTVLRKLHH